MLNENKLLLSFSVKKINKTVLEKITTLLTEDLNWTYIIGKAIHNRVIPQFYVNLSFYIAHNHDHPIPQAMIEKIRRLYYSFIGSSLDLSKEALQLFQLFNTHNVQCALIKGMLLAQTVYSDKLLRFFEDVDLLLPNQRELKKAEKILRTLRYERRKEVVYLKQRHDMLLKFDLHHSFSLFSFFDYPPQLKDFWELSTIQEIEGVPVTVMSGEYMLLLLCLHSFANGSLSLRDLSDSMHILRQYPHLNWDFILQRTQEYPCAIGTPLHLFHLICTAIFDKPLIPLKYVRSFNKYFIPQLTISKKILEEHVYPFPYVEICQNCEKYSQCKIITYISFKEKTLANQSIQKNASKIKNYLILSFLEYNYIFTNIAKKYGVKYALQSFFKESKGILSFIINSLHNIF